MKKPVIAYEKETDPFSTMLASAVHDSTILRKDVAKEIVVQKPAEQIHKDSSNTVAANNASTIDSTNKDLAKATVPEKTNELTLKDTAQTTASIIKADIPKQDSVRNDSVKTGIAKEITPPISNEVKQKDSAQITAYKTIAVPQADSLKTDIAKETITAKSDEIKDTAQSALKSDVAVGKSKKKIKRKSEPAVVQNDAEIQKPQSPVFIDDVAVAVPKKNRRARKSNNAFVDSTVAQKDIAKEIVPEKRIETPKDSIQTITSNSDVAVIKSKKKRAKNNNTVLIDSTVAQKDIAKEIIPEKTTEIAKDATQTKTSTSDVAVIKSKKKRAKRIDNALQDSVVLQKDLAKEASSDKVNRIMDTARSPSANMDVALIKSVIKRKSKKSSKEGLFMLYVDDNGETKDTISILIPSEKKIKEEKIAEPVFSSTIVDDKSKEVVGDKNKADYSITKEEKEIIKEANKKPVFIPSMINSDCKSVATDDDFLKIRKKMVAENNDEDMVKAARKFFKTKCFTTEQIKNLSVLFLKDESKLMFFEAAYPFASDSDQYHNLEKQLTDNNYITRFRAMIHK
jgi:hypothetical protein